MASFSYRPKLIHPPSGISDCPILFMPDENIIADSSKYPKLRKIAGATDIFAIGPLACDRCVHSCKDAVIEASLESVLLLGGFSLQETEVTIGTRLPGPLPKGGKTQTEPNSPTQQEKTDTAQSDDIQSVDRILEDIRALEQSKGLAISPEGDITPTE